MPDHLIGTADHISNIKQMSAAVAAVDHLDLPRHITLDAEFAIKVYIEHSDWHRTNYHPSVYDRLSSHLNKQDLALKHIETVSDQHEDDSDFVITRLILTDPTA